MASGIFISYRRDDTAGFAGRLYDRLAARYGDERVFMDIDTIRPGSDFASDIARALSDSAACIVLIGPQWPSIAKPDGSRRLDDPTDFVRLEVAAALRRGIVVIPVLVQGASPPSSASLPDDLQPLAGRHAIELSSERWNYDVGRLLLTLDDVLGEAPAAGKRVRGGTRQKERPATPEPRGDGRRRGIGMPRALVAGGAVVVAAVLGFVGVLALRGEDPAVVTGPTGDVGSQSPTGPTGSTGSTDVESCLYVPPMAASSEGVLEGTYTVSVTLECRDGELGENKLWRAVDPQVGESVGIWRSQAWTFSPTESGVRWTIGTIVDATLARQDDGTYRGVDHNSPQPECPVTPSKRPRRLYLSVTGEPQATAFEGWLVITFRCQGRFAARLAVTGRLAD